MRPQLSFQIGDVEYANCVHLCLCECWDGNGWWWNGDGLKMGDGGRWEDQWNLPGQRGRDENGIKKLKNIKIKIT